MNHWFFFGFLEFIRKTNNETNYETKDEASGKTSGKTRSKTKKSNSDKTNDDTHSKTNDETTDDTFLLVGLQWSFCEDHHETHNRRSTPDVCRNSGWDEPRIVDRQHLFFVRRVINDVGDESDVTEHKCNGN